MKTNSAHLLKFFQPLDIKGRRMAGPATVGPVERPASTKADFDINLLEVRLRPPADPSSAECSDRRWLRQSQVK